MRKLRVVGLLTAGVLVLGGACSDGDSDTGSPSSTTTSTTGAAVTTTAVTGGTTATTVVVATTVAGAATTTVSAPGEVTIRGTVLTVFASARVLQLDPPVNGYSRAALTSETECRRADGSPGSFQDVNDGSQVEVTGEPGAPGTLIARRVVLVG